MATITEDYISFDTAKLLKEKGFNEICYLGYNKNGEYVPTSNRTNSQIIQPDFCFICCPTLQMAMKWLREVHKIVISIFPTIETDMIVREDYNYTIYKNRTVIYQNCSLTYEDAVEAAIRYCLENLL